jgi:hypothetical protein
MEIRKIDIILLIVFVFFISKYSVKEISAAVTYLGKMIYSSQPQIGVFIIIFFVLIILFFNEIKLLFKRVKLR